MKKVFKLLTLATPALILTPVILTGCSSAYEKKARVFKDLVMEEFRNYCTIGHPSGELKPIFEYLIQHIKNLGLTPHNDFYAGENKYGNIWFDLPASEGCENWKKVLMQGHMDMVYAGPDAESMNPIIPVEEDIYDEKTKSMQHVMHSKDNRTSLGADDGVGIATMFALVRDKEIKHGPIRFIITGDEETTLEGAEKISPDVFDSDYLINIDGDAAQALVIACYGCYDCTLSKNVNDNVITTGLMPNCFRLSIDGLHGGHSGEDVGSGYGNAEYIAWQSLNELSQPIEQSGANKTVQLVSVDHINQKGESQKYESNSLIPNVGITFFTDATKDQVYNFVNNTIKDLSPKFFGENWNQVKVIVENKVESPAKALDAEISNKIIKVLGDKKDGLPCGIISWRDEEKHIPGASNNIGPSYLNVNKTELPITFDSAGLGRSYLNTDIDVFAGKIPPSPTTNVKKSYKEIWKNIFGEETGVKIRANQSAWEDKKVNPVRDMLIKGYNDAVGKTPHLLTSYGLEEESFFVHKRDGINMVTIGPRLDYCHTVNETLFMDSMNDEFKCILYALENWNNITNV